jgi:hypothetical protein
MGRLSERDERLLRRLDRTQPVAAIAGLILVLLGAAYLAWALLHFDPKGDPKLDPGFDRPVARIATLFAPYQSFLERIETQTPLEARLVKSLSRGMNLCAGLMLLLVRALFGSGLILTGLAAMTVFVERRRLLHVVGRLRS